MESFAAVRRRAVDQSYLEVSRLEKRLTKVTQVLTDPRLEQEQGAVAYLKSFSGSKGLQRQLEETVVDWEEDQTVLQCPFCQQEFSTYSFRKHHCRLCGRVVCGDLATGCSTEIGLNVKARKSCRITIHRPVPNPSSSCEFNRKVYRRGTGKRSHVQKLQANGV